MKNAPVKKPRAIAPPAEPAAEWVAPSALKPWPKNPRKNDGAIAKVAESIRRFGFAAPIVARRESKEIIAGHTRWKAAKRLGLERVPVRFVDLSEAEAHALALADNRLGEIAEWDTPELKTLLTELDEATAVIAGWDELDLAKLGAEAEAREQRARDRAKDDNHCPHCGRYMSAKLQALHAKRAAE